jgi:hypothetical protein
MECLFFLDSARHIVFNIKHVLVRTRDCANHSEKEKSNQWLTMIGENRKTKEFHFYIA